MHKCAKFDDTDDTEVSAETSRQLFPPITTRMSVSQENVTCQQSDTHDTNINNMQLCTFREKNESGVERNRSLSQENHTSKTSHLNSINTTPALFMKCDSIKTSGRSGRSLVSAKCNFSSIKNLSQTPRQIRKMEICNTPSARHSTNTSVANNYNHNRSNSNNTSIRSFRIIPTDAAAEAEPPLESPLGKVELERNNSVNEELHHNHHHQQQECEGEQNERRPSDADRLRCSSIFSDVRMKQSYSLPSTVIPFLNLKEQTSNSKRHTTNTSTPPTLPTIAYNNENNKIKIEGELWLINNNNDKSNVFNSGLLAYTPTPNRVKSMKLMSNRRQWVVCEDNRLLVYSSWSASYGKLIAEMSFHRVHVLFQFTHSERADNCNNVNINNNDANNDESPFSNVTNKSTRRNMQMSSRHPASVMHNDSSSKLVAANSWARTSKHANSVRTPRRNKQSNEFFSARKNETGESVNNITNNKKRCTKSSLTTTTHTHRLQEEYEEKHRKLLSETRKNDEYDELEQPSLSYCKQVTLSQPEPSSITKRTMPPSPFLSKYYSTSTQNNFGSNIGCNKYNCNKYKSSAVCRKSVNKNNSIINLPCYYYYFGVEGLTHEVTSSTNRRSLLMFCTDSWKAYTIWIRFWNEMTMRYPVITHLLTTSIHHGMSSPEPIPQGTSPSILWEEDDNDAAVRHSERGNALNKIITSNNIDTCKNNEAICPTKHENNEEMTNVESNTNMHKKEAELLHKEDRELTISINHQESREAKETPKESKSLIQKEEEQHNKLKSCNDKIFSLMQSVQNKEEVDRLHVEVQEMCAWVVLSTLNHDCKHKCNVHVMSTFLEEQLLPKLSSVFDKSHQQWIIVNERLVNLANASDSVSRLSSKAMETLHSYLEEKSKTINEEHIIVNDFVRTTCASFTSWNDALTRMSNDVNIKEITWPATLDNTIFKTHFSTSNKEYCNLCTLFREMEERLNTNDMFTSYVVENTFPLTMLQSVDTDVLRTLIASNETLRKAEISHTLNTFASTFAQFCCDAESYKSQELQIMHFKQEERTMRAELHAREQEEYLNYVLHLQRYSAELAVHLFGSVTTLLNEIEEQHESIEEEEFRSCIETVKNDDSKTHLSEASIKMEEKLKEQCEKQKEESRLKEEQHHYVENLERENAELKTQVANLQAALLAHTEVKEASENEHISNNVYIKSDSRAKIYLESKITQLENAITACQRGVNLHEDTDNQNNECYAQDEQSYSAHILSVLDRSTQIINALHDKCTRLTHKDIDEHEQQYEQREKKLRELYVTESTQWCAEQLLDAKEEFMTSTHNHYGQIAKLLYHSEIEQLVDKNNEENANTQCKEELLDTLQRENAALQQQKRDMQRDKIVLEHRNNTLECVIEECKESEKLLEEHVIFLQKEFNTLSTDLFHCNKEHKDALYRTENALVEARNEIEVNKLTYKSKVNEYNEFVKVVSDLTSQLVMSLGIIGHSELHESTLLATCTVKERDNNDKHEEYNDKNDNSIAISTNTSMQITQCKENLARVLIKVMEWNANDAEVQTELRKLYELVTCESNQKWLAECEGAEFLQMEANKGIDFISGPIEHANYCSDAMKLIIRSIYDAFKEQTECKRHLETTLKQLQARLSSIITKIRTSDTVVAKKCHSEDLYCAPTANALQKESEHNSITETLDNTVKMLEEECTKLYAKAAMQSENEHNPVTVTGLQIPQLHDVQQAKLDATLPSTNKAQKMHAREFDDECQLIAEICYMRRLVRKKVADDELTTVHVNHLINMLNLCQSRNRQRNRYR